MPDMPRPESLPPRDFLGEEAGASMLEFVLVAPILCYLIMGILFFHHHIDYAQDSIVRFRQLTWMHAPPGGTSIDGEVYTDRDGFGLPLVNVLPLPSFVSNLGSISNVIKAAPVASLGGGMGPGMLLTADRYYMNGTPYKQLGLTEKGIKEYPEQEYAIPDNPWAEPLAGLGRFFGNRIGGGDPSKPTGYDLDWIDHFPLVSDPWQRHLKRDDMKQLNVLKAGADFLPAGIAGLEIMAVTLDGWTLFRSKTFSDVYKIDTIKDGETRGIGSGKKNNIPYATGSGSNKSKKQINKTKMKRIIE